MWKQGRRSLQGESMPTVVPIQQRTQQYVVISPEGNQIEIPKELFGALSDFLQGAVKPTGSVTIQFRNGGVAGLEAMIKRIYK
jgi:hypothetical protein